jgi:DNA-binding NtrC family response regulator
MEAGDGKQALAVLKNPPEPVQVVMLDYRLPDTNGLQLLAAIRGLSPASRVVMMTAYGTAEVVAEAMRLGAVCVVTKPIEMHDVADIVSRARAS